MYYSLCFNHNYSYELYEILSIFYPGEKLTLCESEDNLPKNCMLIKSVLKNNVSTVYVETFLIKVDDGKYEIISNDCTENIISDNIRKSEKHTVKLSLFKLLRNITGIQIPWGILVGIRPSKIVNDLRSKSVNNDEIVPILKDKYLLRDDKIKLVMEISDNSYDVINHLNKAVSVYIGIPFCPSKCIYCSFASYPISKYMNRLHDYVIALDKEIEIIGSFLRKHFNIDTIYIGGGTPTSLPDDMFSSILDSVVKHFEIASVNEFTVEAGRPDTINQYKLSAMKKSGVNRISINPQSMNDDTLARVGRNHTVQDIMSTFNLARSMGFDNINMDMILGLPGEEISHVKSTIKRILDLSPENITVHTMAVKRASSLKEKLIENEYIPIPDSKKVNDMMEYVQDAVACSGYQPYYMYRQKMMVGNLENIGYCKPGYRCLYNIQMIEEKETIVGIGADAVTKLVYLGENRIERLANKKSLEEYINSIDHNIEKKIKSLNSLT